MKFRMLAAVAVVGISAAQVAADPEDPGPKGNRGTILAGTTEPGQGFSGKVALESTGDEFFILDNISDAIYRSNTKDVSGDVLLSQLGGLFWADLGPSDQSAHLFAADADTPRLVRISEASGSIASEFYPDQQIRSIAYDECTGVLWGINRDVFDNRLYTIEIPSGHTSLVGDTGIPTVITALTFDPDTGNLYAAAEDNLYVIDPADAQTTFIGAIGLASVFGLAWNPSDHLLYGTDEVTDSLYQIDRTDASPTLVGGPYRSATFGTGLSFGDVGGDSDGDGVSNACDPCPLDNPDDTDGDGVCDSEDLCPGEDDRIDTNENGTPDCLEQGSVPTVSQWGLAIMVLLSLSAGAVVFRRKRLPA